MVVEEDEKTEEILVLDGAERGVGRGKKENGLKEKKAASIEIGARDVEVLQWVCEHYFSTKEILLGRFYAESKFLTVGQQTGQYGSRRVTKLLREGYLGPSRYRVLGAVPLLLAPIGYKLLHGQGLSIEHHPVPDIDIANFEHDVWVQRLRTMFELQYGATKWRTDRVLQRIQSEKKLPYVPDARFRIGEQSWNLEVERTPKRKDRLKDLLKVRAEGSHKTRVLYVLDRRFSEFYREHMAVTVNPGCFFITHFDDLGTVHWVGNDGAALPLDKLFQVQTTVGETHESVRFS